MEFEIGFGKFLDEQRAGASGLRLQRLMSDLTGTKKMFKEALFPIFRSFDGFVLEYEFISSSGYRMFIDALNVPYWAGFESEGFVCCACGDNYEGSVRDGADAYPQDGCARDPVCTVQLG